MLVCDSISKRYGSVVALRSANLKVQPGEIHAILGGNGSGKSTLAKIMAGTVQPDGGTIHWNGVPLRIMNPVSATKSGIAVTFQELSLLGNLTVAENICFPAMPTRLGRVQVARMRERVHPLLKDLELEGMEDVLVDHLPSGYQYLVEYAKALFRNPDILVLDEITSALHREQVTRITQSIRALAERGTAVLFVSHRLPEIFSLCDGVTVFRNGENVGTFRTGEVSANQLLALMTGDPNAVDTTAALDGEPYTLAPRSASLEVESLPVRSHKISLSIRSGEIVGIAGIQGQGQSELVRRLFGMHGVVTVTLNGKIVRIGSPRSAVRQGFAFVSGDREHEGTFAQHSLSTNASCVGQFIFHRKAMDIKAEFDRMHVHYHRLSQKMQELSGGNQQKVVLTRWTSVHPAILLADDPTKGVDVAARHEVHQMFVALAESGTAIVMVSSDEEELVALASMYPLMRVLVMYDGTFVQELKGAEVTLQSLIEASIPQEDNHVISQAENL